MFKTSLKFASFCRSHKANRNDFRSEEGRPNEKRAHDWALVYENHALCSKLEINTCQWCFSSRCRQKAHFLNENFAWRWVWKERILCQPAFSFWFLDKENNERASYSILIISQMLCEFPFTSFTLNHVPASETDNSTGGKSECLQNGPWNKSNCLLNISWW